MKNAVASSSGSGTPLSGRREGGVRSRRHGAEQQKADAVAVQWMEREVGEKKEGRAEEGAKEDVPEAWWRGGGG